jgi:prenylcysteine alpha-carboxyl methylesterase
MTMAGRLIVFITVLAPGWYHLLAYFLYDPHVVRNIPYTNKSITSRNYLDLYLPAPDVTNPYQAIEQSTNGKKLPVVIFVSGGAWVIGYKMWSTLVARAMSALGTVVICPDYRNVPQGSIEDMMSDITNSIKWVIDNIEDYGGDKNHIILAGQSAGAHISMALILDAFDSIMPVDRSSIASSIECADGSEICRLSESELEKIKLVIGINGPYNLHILDKHLHRRGLDTSILHWVCNNDVDKFSPTLKFQKMSDRIKKYALHGQHHHKNGGSTSHRKIPSFPSIALYHGSNDATVPCDISVEFAHVLKENGMDVTINVYENLSHTDLILEGPLTGDNKLLRDIMSLVKDKQNHRLKQKNGAFQEEVMDEPRSGKTTRFDIDDPLAPRWLVRIARKMNPF